MKHFNQRKLAGSLQALSDEEFKLLGKWLKSSWHNSNKKLFALYRIIRPYFPKFDHPSLTVDILYDRLFPNKVWDNKIFNNLLGKFRQQVDRFRIDQYLEKRPELQEELLMRDNLERQQNAAFTKLAKKLIKNIQAASVHSEEDLWQLSQFNDLVYFQPSEENRYQADRHFLRQADHYLDRFYILRKFRYLHESNQRNRILQDTEDNNFQIALLKELAQKFDCPALKLYQFCIDHPGQKDRDQTEYFQQQYFSHYHQLAPQEQMIFLTTCRNDAINLSTAGDIQGYRNLFSLYNFGLEKGILLHKGQITGVTYNNYVLAGTLLGEELAVNDFIDKYATALPPKMYEDATNWSTAQLMYSQGHYNNCIYYIQQRTFRDKIYKIQSRVTQTKAYFDLQCKNSNMYAPFRSNCAAFEKYMRRSKLYEDTRREACLKWIRYTKALANIDPEKDRSQQLHKIEHRLSGDSNVFGQLWLIQKIRELEKAGDRTNRQQSP